MIWDIDEREQWIKSIKDFLALEKQPNGSAHLFTKTELSDKIIKDNLEQEKKDLLSRIIKDKDGNWIGIINTNFTPDNLFILEEENNLEDNEPMEKYKWFNKMKDSKDSKDSKSKKDYSKMSQEQLKEEARKIEVIDDDGSTITIGELIERDKQKAQPQNIPQKDSNENISNSNNDTIDDIFENIEQIKNYSDEY